MIFYPCIRSLPLKRHSLKGRSNPWIDGRRHGKPSPRCRVGRGMSCLEERGKEKPHLESTMVRAGIKRGTKILHKPIGDFSPSPQPWLALFLKKLEIFKASCDFLEYLLHVQILFCLYFRKSNNFPQTPQALTPAIWQKKFNSSVLITFPVLLLYSLDFLLLNKY